MYNKNTDTSLCCFDGSGGSGCNTFENLCGIDTLTNLCKQSIPKCGAKPIPQPPSTIKKRYILYNMTADEVSGKDCDNTTKPYSYCMPPQIWNNPDDYCNTMVLCFLDPDKFVDGTYVKGLPDAFVQSIVQMQKHGVDVLISCGGQAANNKWDKFLENTQTTGDNIWKVMDKYNVGFDFDLEEYGNNDTGYKTLIQYVVSKKNVSKKKLFISVDVGGTPCTGGSDGVCNIINSVITDIDWINVMVTAPNQASSLNYWIEGTGSLKPGIGKENINKVVLAYFASYSAGPVLNCKSGSACPSKSDCKCNCANNLYSACFYQASGIQIAKQQDILGISFWNTQTGAGGGSYSGCTNIDPVGFKEGLNYLVHGTLPSGCSHTPSCPSCASEGGSCCTKFKCNTCCNPGGCKSTSVLSKDACIKGKNSGWIWCGS